MRVFVTGASGGIGSAVVAELIAADHQVVGLARSEASVATISQLGAEPLRGDVTDLDVLKRAANDTDGVIYLAFNHDFTQAGDSMGDEARAVPRRRRVARAPKRIRSAPRGRWRGGAAPARPSLISPSAASDRPSYDSPGRCTMPAAVTGLPAS